MLSLVVDDDKTSSLLLQNILSRYGQCRICVNGREAVAAFIAARAEKKPFDLICMDIMMPEMNGHAAVAEIRKLEGAGGTLPQQRVIIIMITALDDLTNVTESLLGSCDGYEVKPIDRTKFLEKLSAFHLI